MRRAAISVWTRSSMTNANRSKLSQLLSAGRIDGFVSVLSAFFCAAHSSASDSKS